MSDKVIKFTSNNNTYYLSVNDYYYIREQLSSITSKIFSFYFREYLNNNPPQFNHLSNNNFFTKIYILNFITHEQNSMRDY